MEGSPTLKGSNREIQGGIVWAGVGVSRCFRIHTLLELFSPSCWKGERKSVAERTSLPHLMGSRPPHANPAQTAKHGQRALSSLSDGGRQQVKAELLCKGQNMAAHRVVPA